MLTIPDNSPTVFRIVGIDPGTTNLGLAVLTVDIKTLIILETTAVTFNANKLTSRDTWNCEVHSDRFDRILSLKKSLMESFITFQPSMICVESPFFGRSHPNAFQALTEVLTAIRDTLYEFNPWTELILVSPSEAKQAISAKGNATKEIMKEKLLLLSHELNLNPSLNIHTLDEHSIDAIAIAYYAYNQAKNSL
jgi:Holliday junction resolvasome RuvABC endonuclease subunit